MTGQDCDGARDEVADARPVRSGLDRPPVSSGVNGWPQQPGSEGRPEQAALDGRPPASGLGQLPRADPVDRPLLFSGGEPGSADSVYRPGPADLASQPPGPGSDGYLDRGVSADLSPPPPLESDGRPVSLPVNEEPNPSDSDGRPVGLSMARREAMAALEQDCRARAVAAGEVGRRVVGEMEFARAVRLLEGLPLVSRRATRELRVRVLGVAGAATPRIEGAGEIGPIDQT